MDADHDMADNAAVLLSQTNYYPRGMPASVHVPVPMPMQFPVVHHDLDNGVAEVGNVATLNHLPFMFLSSDFGLFEDQGPPVYPPELLSGPPEQLPYGPVMPSPPLSSPLPLQWSPVADPFVPPRTMAGLPPDLVASSPERQEPSPAPGQPIRRGPGKRSNPDRVNKPQPRRRRGAPRPTDRLTIMKNEDGVVGAVMGVLDLGPRTRATLTGDKVESTARTRQLGACGDCKKNKWRCDRPQDQFKACPSCYSKAFRSILSRVAWTSAAAHLPQPCIKLDLLSLQLHRKGPTSTDNVPMWTARKWEMIPDINRDYPITFRLTQGFSGEQELCLPVSRFQVTDGDRTAYYWTDKRGRKRKKVMPPYFISNMRVARNNIRQFLDSTRESYVVSLLEGSNPLVRRAFAMAMSHAAGGKSPLVSEALDTWVAARLIESHWRVSSGYSMSDVGPIASEEGHPYRNFNPITPMMDSQFDDLVIREFLSPQRDRILQRLKKMFYDDRRRSNWLEIHLTILIMMSNTGWILKDMMNMMDWKGLKSGSRGGKLTQGYMYTCRTLLAYYHHPYGGSKPFSLDFESLPANDPILRDMSTDQREYMRWMKGEMARQMDKISKWAELDMYKDDAYWVYQMFCEDWEGARNYPGDIDDYTEEDFMSSSVWN